MNTIIKIISLNKINKNNIVFAKYICGCGCNRQHGSSIYLDFLDFKKIKLCKMCGSLMNGTCIKNDETNCMNCPDVICNRYDNYMCGKCGEIVLISIANGVFNAIGELCGVLCEKCKN